MYPNVLFFRDYKYASIDSFFDENKDALLCSVTIVTKDELSLLFDSKYALLVTYGENESDYSTVNETIANRMRSQWLHFKTLDINLFNSAINYCYMTIMTKEPEKSRPIFSIFTTCYHSYDKIKRAYKSVQSQLMNDWEWVILDDSVEEKHFTFLQELFQKEPKVRLYKRSNNSGFIGNVKNEAVSLCRGKYVLELDHDDEIVPSLLTHATKVFEDPEIGFIYTDFINIYENGNNFQYGNHFGLGYSGYYRKKYKGGWVFVAMTPNINSKTLSHIVSIPNHARIWRKDTLMDMGNYNEYLPISDDYELLLRTAVHTKIVKIPMLGYIQYMNNQSNNFSLIRNSEINRLRWHLTEHCYKKWNIDSVMEQKGALDKSDTSLPIWKRPNFEYTYCNDIINMEHTMQYCILGMSAFYQHYSEIKVLYENPQNDFIILDNTFDSTDNTIGIILDKFKLSRIHFYSMKDCSEEELLFYFNHVYKSTESTLFTKKEPILELNSITTVKKVSIITPCIHPENLFRIKESIPFDYVHEWIIVYDESKLSNPHLFQQDNIKEYSCQGKSICGNAQRNYGLDHLTGDTYVYFLDDDNIIHPDFHTILKDLEPNRIYTFGQQRPPTECPYKDILTGDEIAMFQIDTSMFLVDSSLCKEIRWVVDEYASDAIFIVECYSNHLHKWIHLNKIVSYYNYLNHLELFSKDNSCLQTNNMLESI